MSVKSEAEKIVEDLAKFKLITKEIDERIQNAEETLEEGTHYPEYWTIKLNELRSLKQIIE